ncbi:MAG: prepilin-type N-terminal cleavage/methylation domain-containing protein, partial [Planctomycetota bacterium]
MNRFWKRGFTLVELLVV